jgi:hypothetical protein
MRWTDLPPERGTADAGASALSRGEWEDLRRRLERLPPGHPSHPDGEGDAEADPAGRPAEPPGQPGADPEGGQDAAPGEGRGRPERRAGRGGTAAPGDLTGPGSREPYRPWFSTGESAEPWFAADPD